MTKVQIIDAIMGSGKTYDAIERMKKYLQNDTKFIYITPFNNEVDRVLDALPKGNVYTPLNSKNNNGKNVYTVKEELVKENGSFKVKKITSYMNKRSQFLKMSAQGKNIVSTHSLFMSLKKKDYSLFSDYVLILDEVVNPLNIEYIGAKDIQILKNQDLIIINEDSNEVSFIRDDYSDNAFKKVKSLCDTSTVFCLDKYFFVWIFPIEIFKEFKEVQILTYLFKGSLMAAYFDLFNVTYQVESKNSSQKLLDLKTKLNIYSGIANQQKGVNTKFCKTWSDNSSKATADKISNTTSYIFKSVFKTKSSENAYTTFKAYKSKFSGGGYSRGFIPINARATNDFAHKKSMAYLGNRYFSVQESNFFKNRDIELNQDIWALSELIQWVWRGCIRENKPMNLYIPSLRMRNLLIDWLDGKFIELDEVSCNLDKAVSKLSA